MVPQDSPLVSLLIPTRERARYLKYTLETALQPGRANYEIIVSDNCSEDETAQTVRSFSDPRIRYFNTRRRLNMCDNFEFALSRARGRFVIAIGDDDGMMPGAFSRIEELVRTEPAPAYWWQPHCYQWPAEGRPASAVVFRSRSGSRKINLRRLARLNARLGGFRYHTLPRLYHSVVERVVLDRLREKTGRVFHSTQPDVFLSYTLPAYLESALDVGTALTVQGRAERHVALGHLDEHRGAAFERKIRRFYQEYEDYAVHRTLDPRTGPVMNGIPDAVLVAMELSADAYAGTRFNYSAMWAHLVTHWQWDSISGIIAKRRRFRRFHDFSVPQFLLMCLFFRLSRLRQAAKRIAGRRAARGDWPDNIRDFVRELAARTGTD